MPNSPGRKRLDPTLDIPEKYAAWLVKLRDEGDQRAFAEYIRILRRSCWSFNQIARALRGPASTTFWNNAGDSEDDYPSWVPAPWQVVRGDDAYPPLLARTVVQDHLPIPLEDVDELRSAYLRAVDGSGTDLPYHLAIRRNDNFRARDELSARAEQYMDMGIPLTAMAEAMQGDVERLKSWVLFRRGVVKFQE